MGKTYIDTVKYVVYANVEISGLVEKPDVVGAVFGQTEGLMGDTLDLRELQKNGKIGRIEVDLQVRGGKSVGKITLPSSLDMVETSILAAALETVDRVGPCEAHIGVEKIEDTRNVKRKAVIDRAKFLLKKMLSEEIPESKEISEMVRQEVKIAEISEYGPEKLPCGPNINSYDSIIVVEGRADVLNLLKNDINNTVAVGGANVPKSLSTLCKEKEITLFLDGDRGGDIILRELTNETDVDYVARAPRGREVEELTRKEIIKCLRSRAPLDQVQGYGDKNGGDRNNDRRQPRYDSRRDRFRRDGPNEQQVSRPPSEPLETEPIEQPQKEPEPLPQVPDSLKTSLVELENTLRARVYDQEMKVKQEIPVRDLMKNLEEGTGVQAVVLDGIITQRLVDLAENKGVKFLVGVRQGNFFRKPERVAISTKEAQ